MEILQIPTGKVIPDPNQPRKEFEPAEMKRLEESIKSQGILVPLILEQRGKNLVIVDGERRWRTAKKVGLKSVPAVVEKKKLDDIGLMLLRFHIQEQHANWTAFDKARAVSFVKETLNVSDQKVAEMLGIPPRTLLGYSSLLALSPATRKLATEQKVPYSFLRAISAVAKEVENPSKRKELELALLDKCLTGTIESVAEMMKYKSAVRGASNKEKILQGIIEKKDYTADQALEEAKVHGLLAIRRIHIASGWLVGSIAEVIRRKEAREMQATDVKILEKLKGSIEKLIESAGFIEGNV